MDAPSTLRTAQAVGLTATFFLSGVTFAASHLMIHNLYPLPTAAAATVFADLYRNGARVVIPLALGSAVSWSIAAYMSPKSRTEHSIAVAGTLGTMVFTRVVMMGVNNQLMEISRMGEEGMKVVRTEDSVELLKRWKGMNLVRSGLAFVSGCAGLVAIMGQ